jgi:glycosyltransferase involved in cell wall biosynthesis
MPFFSIITPTYKRGDKLQKAVDSVLAQTHKDFEMIIVNDSPDDLTYAEFEDNLKIAVEHKIKYVKNDKNSGVNFTRNRGLDLVSEKADWILFLDDDDIFTPETLETFARLIQENPVQNWFVANRAMANGKSLTDIGGSDIAQEYIWNFLITRRFNGDATHCINKSFSKNIYFSKTVRQGDEWFFFFQLSLKSYFFYHDFNATITDGYQESGLNYRERTTMEQLRTIGLLVTEGAQLGIAFSPSFIVYMCIRFVRAFVKHS